MTRALAVRSSPDEETMRQRFGAVIDDLVTTDERLFVLLTDISADHLSAAAARHPDRVVGLGIMEQTAMSAAAGVALEGFIPVVHSIAPFIVHRPYEQLRDDFVYQRLGVNVVSIGASYDYAADGYTHNAPDDVPALLALGGVEVIVPGTPTEFEALFRASYANGSPTYVRLSLERNARDRDVRFGELHVVRRSPGQPVVVAFGPVLDRTLAAVRGLDVSVLYATTVRPVDGARLRKLAGSEPRVLLVEPWFTGALVADVLATLRPRPARVESVGVRVGVTRGYGTPQDHDRANGLTPDGIRRRLIELIDGD
jgi:transketolase